MMEKSEPLHVTCRDIIIPRSFWPEVPLRPNLLYIERMHGPRRDNASLHHFPELLCIASGNGSIHIKDRQYPVEAGDVMLIPPLVEHAERGNRSFDTIWVGFTADPPEGIPAKPAAVHSPELAAMIGKAWRAVRAARPFSGPELDGRLLTILGIFLRLLHAKSGKTVDDKWETVFNHMRENFASPLEIARLAAMAGCSKSYFFRRFAVLMGCTPLQYVTRLRLQQVKMYLLHSRLPLAEIAKVCGFNDPYYLSKSFRAHFGVSPDAFRKA